nr:MAG TPA: tail collar domain [Caudoviricetes sp.]
MKRTLGNFLTQANKDFPIDAETFDSIQQNQALLAVIGNIAGDKAILKGCEEEQGGIRRKEGYVFLRTIDFPEGEVLFWEGGVITGGMYLKKEAVSVNAQGYEFPQAYTTRSLAPGLGTEQYSWSDFREIPDIQELMAKNAALEEAIAKLTPPPLGIVQMWAGSKIPEGYLLCEGQQLKQSEYPELYAALGTTFNSAYSADGTRYSTTSGYFRLPDLRGRFVVGYHVSDRDYSIYGAVGGSKQHTLTVNQMPVHSHPFKDYYYPESHVGQNSDAIITNDKIGSSDTDYDNNRLCYYKHDTESKGGGQPHENRPPYYVLAYIMRTK